jgi:hypothetical protein
MEGETAMPIRYSSGLGSLRMVLGYAVCLLALPLAAHAQSRPTVRSQSAAKANRKGNLVMQIQFVRAGGFAGPATRVAGTLTLEDAAAHVASEGSGYHRDLPASEADPLRTAARLAKLETTQGAPASSPFVPDAYEYRIAITAEDGKTYTFTVHGEGASPQANRLAPNAAQLAHWIQQETQSIWQYRLRTRP